MPFFFMPPKLEGYVDFGLYVSVWVCVLGWVFVGWGVCQWEVFRRCGWLAQSVGRMVDARVLKF